MWRATAGAYFCNSCNFCTPSAADPDGASGDGLDIPDFLDRRPALRPTDDRLDDLR
jgi:hypothetical protein